ncbi:MAG: transcriptional repressor [Myxococcales bacterium]|nr:transcriptional repressor [Myxococcales bacterium]
MKRKTEQRALIREVMGQTTRPLTANEVLDLAQEKRAGLGIATVYRTINGLVEEGWLLPVELPGEPARYERRELEHHHHFQCQACRKVFDVPGCSGLPTTGVPTGFEVARHEIVFYGRCAECVVNRVQVPDDEYRSGESDAERGSQSFNGHLASCSPDCGHDHGVKAGRAGAIAARKPVQGMAPVSVVGVEAAARRKDP